MAQKITYVCDWCRRHEPWVPAITPIRGILPCLVEIAQEDQPNLSESLDLCRWCRHALEVAFFRARKMMAAGIASKSAPSEPATKDYKRPRIMRDGSAGSTILSSLRNGCSTPELLLDLVEDCGKERSAGHSALNYLKKTGRIRQDDQGIYHLKVTQVTKAQGATE